MSMPAADTAPLFRAGPQIHETQEQQQHPGGAEFGNFDDLDFGELSTEDFSTIDFRNKSWNPDMNDNPPVPDLSNGPPPHTNKPADSWSGHRQPLPPQGRGAGVQFPPVGPPSQTDLMPQPPWAATSMPLTFNAPGQGLPTRQSAEAGPQVQQQPASYRRQRGSSFHKPAPLATGRPSPSSSRSTQVARRVVAQDSDSYTEDGERCHRCGHHKLQGNSSNGSGSNITPAATPTVPSSAPSIPGKTLTTPRDVGSSGTVSNPEVLREHGINPARLAQEVSAIARQQNEDRMSQHRGSITRNPTWEMSESGHPVRHGRHYSHEAEVPEDEDADDETEYVGRPDGRSSKVIVVYMHHCNCR